MKRIFYAFVLSCLLSTSVFSQDGKLGFDNTSGPDFGINIYMDTATSNFWRIGKPNGIIFNEAYQSENAIFTDKTIITKDSVSSSFSISFKTSKENSYLGKCYFKFNSKIDANSLEYGNIFISYDNGISWQNIFDTVFKFWYCYNDSDLTKYNNPPLKGSYSNWINCEFDLYLTMVFKSINPLPDSILIRFNFMASKNKSTEGWMFDNFGTIVSYEVGIEENEKKIILFNTYNNNKIPVEINGNPSDYKISFYDMMGRNISNDFIPESINIELPSYLKHNGIYLIKIYNTVTEETFIKKIINY